MVSRHALLWTLLIRACLAPPSPSPAARPTGRTCDANVDLLGCHRHSSCQQQAVTCMQSVERPAERDMPKLQRRVRAICAIQHPRALREAAAIRRRTATLAGRFRCTVGVSFKASC